MTDITKVAKDDVQRAKWRAEAARIAIELRKRAPEFAGKEEIKVGVAFNDQVVTLQLPTATIRESSEGLLAILIYDGVLRMQDELPAPPPIEVIPPAGAEAAAAPQGPAHTEPCWRRLEPDFKEACPNQATGGIGITLYPHESIQKRYGKKPMLDLILHIPVCPSCFARMTPTEVLRDGLAEGQWGDISKAAQRRCNGILPAKEETAIAHVPFSEPKYVMLRQHIAKQRVKDIEPAESASVHEAPRGE